MKCYMASFNIGDIEVWSSDLYLNKNHIFLEINATKQEIIERVECFSVFSEELSNVWNDVVSDMEKHGKYGNNMYGFDFFILDMPIREKFELCEAE